MKVLITGAQGQIGRALVQAFSSHTVTAFSRKELNITDPAQIEKAFRLAGPEIVLNAAAYTQVDEAETDAAGAFAVNEQGPLLLALQAAQQSIPVLHFSTDYVFDGTVTVPYLENAKPNPLSVYGQSKWAGERAVQENNPRHYLVRTAWIYDTVGKNFPTTMLSLATKPAVRVVNDQIGSPTYAPHLAASIVKLVERMPPWGVYHLAGSGKTSWYDLTRALFDRLHITTPVVPVSTAEFPRPARRPAFAALGSSKATELALPPWEQGLDDFVKHIKNI